MDKHEKQDIIINFIKENIENGRYKPNKPIMSEPLLAERFSMARLTVRRAIDKLVKEDILYKVKGSGTYIKNNIKKKYVIIGILDLHLYNELFYTFQYVSGQLKNLIEKLGYTVIIYHQVAELAFFDFSKIDPKDIEFFISLNMDQYVPNIWEKQIPVINVLGADKFLFNYIGIDIVNLHNNIINLIEKYNFNPLIFMVEPEKDNKYNDYTIMLDGFYYNFLLKNYNVVPINGSASKKERAKVIKDTILNLDYTPDVIVFTDDTFFKSILPDWKKIEHKVKNCPIITHANKPDNVYTTMDVCKITFNLDDFCNKIVEFMLQILNKDYIKTNCILIPLEVENEEILEKYRK